MKFPTMGDIASTSVAKVSIDDLLKNAILVMLEHNHRNVIVEDNKKFKILTVLDVLNIQKKSIDLETKLSGLNLVDIPTIDKEKNVLETVEYLNNSIEYICVVNSDKTLYGLVTHTDITSNIDPDTLMENYKLVDFLKLGSKMKCVEKDTITSTIFDDMIEDTYDSIVVVEHLKPIGILTTKDILKLIKDNSDLSREISNYMSAPIEVIHKDSSIKDALEFVKQKHYKRVIVVDDKGKLAGIITQKELITLSYSRWAVLMKEYQNELSEINNMLKDKNREYEMIASADSLTGLYNRRKFTELFYSSQLSMVQRKNKMSLIMLDLDRFKSVNDTYGHNVGDNVLVQISHVLLRNLRNIDIIGRWGGEEFVALVPTADLKKAVHLAHILREEIAELNIDIVGKVTSSFGVTEVRREDRLQDVIERADKALYLAKNSGRNCVKTEEDLK